ncbi:MAG: glycosyltransferase [Holophaga sp.]|nr:glycosyltransferase [Holophaga sp.]
MPNTLTIALMTHNRSRYLRQTLESVLNQTYRDFDLLVLDNGSTDDTTQVVSECKDPRLTYIRHPPGHGPEYNGYSALWFSRTKRLLFAHDDDILEPTMVEKQMKMMDAHPRMVAVATNVSLIDEDGRTTQAMQHKAMKDTVFEKGQFLDYFLRTKFIWPASAVMVLREIVPRDRMGKEVDKAKDMNLAQHFHAGDIHYACLLNAKGQYGFLGEPLMRYRIHRGQDCNTSHLVQSEMDLMKALQRAYPREPTIRAQWVGIEGALLRCRVYDLLMQAHEMKDIPALKKKISRVNRKWEAEVPPRMRAHDVILPYEILLHLLGMESSLPHITNPLSRLPHIQDPCPRALRAWFTRLHQGGTLFSKSFPHKRIAILGSAFVAYLLVLEAQRAGVEVVCCLESKTYRHADKVLDVPIVPHEWLRDHAKEIDAVLLSSERNHEEWLETIVRSHCGGHLLPVLSWKTMVL